MCMGSLYHCIVSRAHLENDRSQNCDFGSTTTSGSVKYEAVLHSCGTSPLWGARGGALTCDNAHSL